MNTKEDDDTLPLTVFGQDLPEDVTVDEDFIPTSQPQSHGSSNAVKITGSSCQEVTGEVPLANIISNSQFSFSEMNSAVPISFEGDQSLDKDKSSDFIPETETKKRKLDYTIEEGVACKRLPLDDQCLKSFQDTFSNQESIWNMGVSKIPESPDVQPIPKHDESSINVDVISETVPLCSEIEGEKKCEESITEILVDDSAETVDLEESVKSSSKKPKLVMDSNMSLENNGSFSSDVERCEETQVFDNSSILLLDQKEELMSFKKAQVTQSSETSQKFYLEETIDDNEVTSTIQEKQNTSVSLGPIPVLRKMSQELNEGETSDALDVSNQNGNVDFNKENKMVFANPSSKISTDAKSPSSVDVSLMEFKLSVSCMVSINSKTRKVMQKVILNVNEISQAKPKRTFAEQNSDSSDKSKRCSTSSSGSVYSDKTGLPLPLPKRFSAVSDQTDASDSSEEGFFKLALRDITSLERTPWSNEYMLPMKMDELMKIAIENPENITRPINKTTFRKFKNRKNGLNHLEEILESSSYEFATENKVCDKTNKEESESERKDNQNMISAVKLEGNEESELGKEEKLSGFSKEVENEKQIVETEKADVVQNENSIEPPREPSEGQELENFPVAEEKTPEKEEGGSAFIGAMEKDEKDDDDRAIELQGGLPVFARWTDKRYYSGTLSGVYKNDRWEIKFDDGTSKAIREEFIMPSKWLKVGELVFALIDDKYESGQIIDIKSGKEKSYVVELDESVKSKVVTVKVSDLCLTEVMAGIVREKYKSMTPHAKSSSNIDFDNVLTGKRHREQRTPLKPTLAALASSPGTKKKSSSKSKKESGAKIPETNQDSPQTKESGKKKSSSLIHKSRFAANRTTPEKLPTETDDTPLRSVSREPRRKVKPRSLSYEGDESLRSKGKAKGSEGLAPDGTPIPGPSGVKSKPKTKKASKAEESSSAEENSTLDKSTDSETSPVAKSAKKNAAIAKKSPLTGGNRGKRKLECSGHEISSKSFKKAEVSKKKTRTRKG